MGDVSWPFEHEVRVIWRDMDPAGHVNNAVYFTYMESARTEAFLRLRGGESWRDLDIILARTTLDFRSPATLHETLVVRLWPTRVGGSAFTLRYEIREREGSRLVAEGESVQVMFDYEANRSKPIPDEMRARLAAGIPENARGAAPS